MYPINPDDLIEYTLDEKKIECKGHHEGKNKREIVTQILNSNTTQNSKWLVLARNDLKIKGWVHFQFETPIYIRGFGLRSAINAPHRDPYAFELLAKIEGIDST